MHCWNDDNELEAIPKDPSLRARVRNTPRSEVPGDGHLRTIDLLVPGAPNDPRVSALC